MTEDLGELTAQLVSLTEKFFRAHDKAFEKHQLGRCYRLDIIYTQQVKKLGADASKIQDVTDESPTVKDGILIYIATYYRSDKQ